MSNNTPDFLKPFVVDYAKSSRSKCQHCHLQIQKDDFRLGTREWLGDVLITRWYHWKCVPSSTLFLKNINNVANVYMLKYEDQIRIFDKTCVPFDPTSDLEKKIKTENEEMFLFKNTLLGLKKKTVNEFLTLQGYRDQRGLPLAVNRMIEFLTYGVTKKCGQCFIGNMIYEENVYQCRCRGRTGVRCMFTTETPQRVFCLIPPSMMQILSEYVPRVKNKTLRLNRSEVNEEEPQLANGNDENIEPLPTSIISQDDEPPKKKVKISLNNLAEVKDHDDVLAKESKMNVVRSNDGKAYECLLFKIDIQLNRNSLYKVKILEDESNRDIYLVKEYGRIGFQLETISKKMDCENALNKAIEEFMQIFLEKTGNEWSVEPHNFNSLVISGSNYTVLNTDYRERSALQQVSESLVTNHFDDSVKDLMLLICETKILQQILLEMGIVANVPFSMLSRENLCLAEKVLGTIGEWFETLKPTNKGFLMLSGLFYRLIPQSNGYLPLPTINNKQILKVKKEQIRDLLNMEVTFTFLHGVHNNPILGCYRFLDTEISTLDPLSDEHAMLTEYSNNTRTTDGYHPAFEIVDIFKVQRYGDDERFRAHENCENRVLLWHGSDTKNYGSIFKNGLLIAPPSDVAINGKMFGRGIYFADMCSKSVQYSKPVPQGTPQGEALILVCEVALGNSHEVNEWLGANFCREMLPEGTDSVKAVGQTYPEGYDIFEGVKVPLGIPHCDEEIETVLRHNEFIIYEESRCKIKYLMKIRFIENLQTD